MISPPAVIAAWLWRPAADAGGKASRLPPGSWSLLHAAAACTGAGTWGESSSHGHPQHLDVQRAGSAARLYAGDHLVVVVPEVLGAAGRLPGLNLLLACKAPLDAGADVGIGLARLVADGLLELAVLPLLAPTGDAGLAVQHGVVPCTPAASQAAVRSQAQEKKQTTLGWARPARRRSALPQTPFDNERMNTQGTGSIHAYARQKQDDAYGVRARSSVAHLR